MERGNRFMKIRRKVTERITISDQPTLEDLSDLAAEGFAAVVNLRRDGELEMPMTSMEEGEAVRSLGMDYLHAGIGSEPESLTLESMAAFGAFLDRWENRPESGPILVHCRKSGRAAAMVLIREAYRRGWRSHEACALGVTSLGLQVEGPLRRMVETWLSQKVR